MGFVFSSSSVGFKALSNRLGVVFSIVWLVGVSSNEFFACSNLFYKVTRGRNGGMVIASVKALFGTIIQVRKEMQQAYVAAIKEKFGLTGSFVLNTLKSFRLVPSYKRMCITILKNDTSCRYMGYSQTKDELQKQKVAIKQWTLKINL